MDAGYSAIESHVLTLTFEFRVGLSYLRTPCCLSWQLWYVPASTCRLKRANNLVLLLLPAPPAVDLGRITYNIARGPFVLHGSFSLESPFMFEQLLMPTLRHALQLLVASKEYEHVWSPCAKLFNGFPCSASRQRPTASRYSSFSGWLCQQSACSQKRDPLSRSQPWLQPQDSLHAGF